MIVRQFWLAVVGLALAWAARGAVGSRPKRPAGRDWQGARPVEADGRAR